MDTLNLDLVLPSNYIGRIMFEIYKSQSANVNNVLEADKTRLKKYLSALRTYVDHISDHPDLDLPETNPDSFPANEAQVEIVIENQALSHVCRLLRVAQKELMSSQSSRYSCGLFPDDRRRFLDIITKIEKLVENFVNNSLPLDFVESSPMAPLQGHGNNGLGIGK